jgi:hypothetical protein
MTEHKNIYIALSAAQAEMGPVVKGAVNPHFRSKYADLADVMQVALPALNKHGIAAWHSTVIADGTTMMRTTLSHGESDTHINCDVPLIVAKNDMQGMKSATTYAKRIGIESLTGIAPEDDDGNAAAKAAPKQEAPKPISEKLFTDIKALIEETATDEDKFCAFFKVQTLHDMTAQQAADAIAMLGKKRMQQAQEKTDAAHDEAVKADLNGDQIPY